MKKVIGQLTVVIFLILFAASARAALYNVSAISNSLTGGAGSATINLTEGQAFTVTADPNDIWSSGPIPRWSNADGLIRNLYATGTDESGQVSGTLIGQNWGFYAQGLFSAPYGSLVGRIGTGSFFLIGTTYSGSASTTGTLSLYYWDSNNGDNLGNIVADVSAVPIPGALLLFGPGLAGLAILRKRLKK
jgi:hypothetical protein